MKKGKKLYFFFPYYHSGGAEKAHLQIVKCFPDYDCQVFFTDRSRDNKNKKEFYKSARCFNFFGINNKIKFIEKILVFYLAKIINKTKGAVVFGSNSRFFYSLIKKLNKDVKIIDIVHWLDGKMGEIIIKNTPRVNQRIVVTDMIISLLEKKYKEQEFRNKEIEKIKIIGNCVTIGSKPRKDFNGKLKILYIGRNTYEKRPELAALVWSKLRNNKNFEFLFVGRGLNKLIADKSAVIELIKKEEEINNLYKDAHIIFLTSLFEGFPCVAMEAMSQAVIPVMTAVGGIPGHLINNVNGILIYNKTEKEIVDNIVSSFIMLEKNRELLQRLSDNAFEYAKQNFVCDNFCLKYKKIIEQ